MDAQPVVVGDAVVVVKAKGVVAGVPGHSTTFRMMVPFFPHTATRQAPSPSVVL